MPTLADTLSALLVQAARARVEADRETARIALLYQEDELLRTMPVPRFRLPTLAVELPVAVVDLADPQPAVLEVLPLESLDPWRTRMLDRWKSALRERGYDLAEDETLRQPIDAHVRRWQEDGRPVPFPSVRDAVTTTLSTWPPRPENLNPPAEADVLPALRTVLRDVALELTRSMLVIEDAPPPATPPPADVQVEIGTAALRALGTGTPLTSIRLSITEEGVEVNHVDQDGVLLRRLSPE